MSPASASAPLPRKSDLRHLDDLDAALSRDQAKDKDSALSSLLDPYDPYCTVSDSDSPSPTSPLAFPASAPTTLPTTATTSEAPFPLLSPAVSPLPSPALSPPPLSPSPPPPSYKSPATCPLCSAPVSPTSQAAFYAGRRRTVRNQMLFCRAHKRAAALEAYRAAGYPDVAWETLPGRIRAMRAELVGVLRGENLGGEGGVWREKFGERLRSGRAAVVAKGRKGGKAERARLSALRERIVDGGGGGGVEVFTPDTQRSSVDDEDALAEGEEEEEGPPDDAADADADVLSSTACLAGYFGPRGRRVFMETLTAELGDELRQAATTDPTVGRSGFAMFLQAVMVPELVVRLVMEDLGVGRERAGEVVRESWGVGGLVNEEVEEVVVGDEEEEEEDD